jgi:multiple sugar transport system substrate-binding protein
MTQRRALTIALASLLLATGACTAGGTTASTSPPPTTNASHAPVTITVWSFFTGRELQTLNGILDGVTQQYPWITINSVGGKENTAIQRAINSGTAPDVAIECCPDDAAKYCSSGAWIDLNGYIKRDHLDITSISPTAALSYTSYQGVQCSLPMLSDAYGLYYNTDMFQAAGISAPPKTFSELEADAKKLTTFNPDGSIKVAGFVPLANFYETPQLTNGIFSGATWYGADGKSTVGTDPRWVQQLEWQKGFIDWYGYDKLTKFFQSLGGPDSEWTASQAFETGKVAMTIDGEWRVAFIDSDKADVSFATAPFPVADDIAQEYGLGQIGGTIIGVPKGSANEADAWNVVKYMALGTQPLQALAEALKNVPTTNAALNDPTLSSNPNFQTFLTIFGNPNSAYKQTTPLGTYDVDTMTTFVEKYLAGNAPDLQGGLQQVAKQIDDQAQLG